MVASIVLQVIADPNVAFLLLVIGIVGVTAELYHPGSFAPGIVGAISLVLAMVALGNLPTNWGAVALIGFSLTLFLMELHITSHGILGTGAVVAFLLGGSLLFRPTAPGGWSLSESVVVSPWLLLAMCAGLAGFFLVALRAGLRARRLPVLDPLMRLPGALGVAASPLAPEGTVRVQRETWSAVSFGEEIEPGEEVEIVAREGLTLHVRRMSPRRTREFSTLPSQGEIRPGVWVQRTR
jgi:membrane-bound serine protease (ClpP class)